MFRQKLKPLIKWPGGKSKLIPYLEPLLPESFNRYIEPFVGGGALFFHLNYPSSAINDINSYLIKFYTLIATHDRKLRDFLFQTAHLWDHSEELIPIESTGMKIFLEKGVITEEIISLVNERLERSYSQLPDFIREQWESFRIEILNSVEQKLRKLNSKLGSQIKKVQSSNFVYEFVAQLTTAKKAGIYYFFRTLINDRKEKIEEELFLTAYIFVREFCFGSMFRFNREKKFNIPYGGKAYNKKSFLKKVKYFYSPLVQELLRNTTIENEDFRSFFEKIKPTSSDFIFLDPPYLSQFSTYENYPFSEREHRELANILKELSSKFLLIIEDNETTRKIYSSVPGERTFLSGTYTYSARGRNNRDVTYLVIRNYS
jgi:DNA adenine methylase